MLSLIRLTTSRTCIDLEELPQAFHRPVRDYTHGVLCNQELEPYQGRWLLPVSLLDAADDDTPDDVVQSMARGDIGFAEYPFDGIAWDMLGVTPTAYAGYLLAMRTMRTLLPPEVIDADAVHLLV